MLAASRARLLVVGSGWGAFAAATPIVKSRLFDVTFVSPRNHLVFTPLVPAAAVGSVDCRSIAEPIMHSFPSARFELGECTGIDVHNRIATVRRTVGSTPNISDTAQLPYDALILAVGARNNTFNIPGVRENAKFLKNLSDARELRRRIVANVESATADGISLAEKQRLLSFVIVGGGPTGVEFAAELHDFVCQDLVRLYPEIRPHFSITIVEGKQLLGAFDASLRDFMSKKFARDGIRIRTGANVVSVGPDSVTLSDGSSLVHGMLVWNTGLAPQDLISSLDASVWRKDRWGHAVVDDSLRVLSAVKQQQPVDASNTASAAAAAAWATETASAAAPQSLHLTAVWAVGDCAAVTGKDYAATAQVAEQQGEMGA